jgi:hypothetical protein
VLREFSYGLDSWEDGGFFLGFFGEWVWSFFCGIFGSGRFFFGTLRGGSGSFFFRGWYGIAFRAATAALEFFQEALGEAFAGLWDDDFCDGGDGALDGIDFVFFDL